MKPKSNIEILSEVSGLEEGTIKQSYSWVLKAMDQYSEQNCDIIHDLFNNPCKELKPLEDLWREENPRPNFTIPDTTKFYKWIRIKILGK